ncbi:MAG TPA: hypothetical protein VFU60_13970 [Ktedonobacterales bacterium]|jgi:hypothetical protein|nr:hypothetical protein [Ktedonobacterales bacterium]
MDVARLDDIRLTVVDEAGTVSFVAHASAAVALTAACSHNPTTLRDLLDASERYDRGLRATVLRGLAVFDEHNLPDDLSHIHSQLGALPPRQTPVFRVLDTVTREASLRPVRTGVVLFNLPARRIVQIENTYEPLTQSGEVNYHNGRFLSIRQLPYQLSSEWAIVP